MIAIQASPGINVRPYIKNRQIKKGWGGSSGRTSSRSSKFEALNSNPSATKKKKLKKKQ
jgi:hypothetical protein